MALTAGMTGPASATGPHTEKNPDRAATAASGTTTDKKSKSQKRWLTLITGDRVQVDAKGRMASFQPAPGRKHVPVRVLTVRGHTHVIPADARKLIDSGTLDRRLFDITELARASAGAPGLKLIVGYGGSGAPAARAQVRGTGETRVRRTLAGMNADAVTTPAGDTPALWKALTRADKRGTARGTASGISRIWLDGRVQAHLDKSVAQIGAPAVWKTGYQGDNVTIAVLDTGVDANHPDLRTQLAGAKNFTPSPDTKDRYGHGTHVASIAAGTGAKSGGKFKGVAPRAKVLNGKVLGDDGSGDESGIIAGIDWAVAQGAAIINMSLGGGDGPDLDPLETHVNKVTAEKDVLFTISAGNSGPDQGTVGSPGSAESALTVGAVDDRDRIADFSSVGPRVGDGAIKPDVTAPGVDTTAAAAPGSLLATAIGEKPPGYTTLSGTSMAAPHAAGAAALLKQRHPGWGAAELKAALTASAVPGAHTPFQQGTGRIAVDRAIGQTVFSDAASVNFGIQQWPHADDTPVTKKITYRNSTKTPVTLRLSIASTAPDGRPTPVGFFSVGARTVTVPGNGTASVDVTANTKLGSVDGAYAATVVATGGGQSVRTTAAVDREVESYNLTVRYVGRDGAPNKDFEGTLYGLEGVRAGQFLDHGAHDGTTTIRAARGSYVLDAYRYQVKDEGTAPSVDWLVQPRIDITKDTTVTVDARTAGPVRITVPDDGAREEFTHSTIVVDGKEAGLGSLMFVPSSQDFRTGQLGPDPKGVTLSQSWQSILLKGKDTEYSVLTGGKVKRLSKGFTKAFTDRELTTVKVGLGASAPGKVGTLAAWGSLPNVDTSVSIGLPQKLPGIRTLRLSTLDRVVWGLDLGQYAEPTGPELGEPEISAYNDAKSYAPQRVYTETFNAPVIGPRSGGDIGGAVRVGDEISAYLPVHSDGAGHWGWSLHSSAKTTLHRGTTKIGENNDPLTGVPFTVPRSAATYTLKSTIQRSPQVAPTSSKVDLSWTFRSQRPPAGTEVVPLPISTARFVANASLDGTAPAGRLQSVPVQVEGAAAGRNLKSLYVYASYDYGTTWQRLAVSGGKVTVKNPQKGKGIAFRALITDKKGNASSVTIQNAYYGG
ncbi:S8 family serine peptidase [Streptomyces sp. NPDC057638]|uniref:S8 family peptidase n=1 Tax=Streptomyces sp. NPDC057638 TaxID=3346190 RepID=UPI00368AC8B4